MIDHTFQRLISHLHRGGGYGYVWELPTKRVRWWPADDPTQIPAAWAGHNVYFGVNPSTVKRTHKRATNETIAALNCVFAEFDAKDHERGKDGALAHVLALPAQPSVIVDSGGGYHCYWLLSETFHIASDEDRTLAKDTQAAWVALVASDGGAKDLARVLRVPGQMNYKYDPPRRVEFVRADFDLLYDWQTVVDLAGTATAAERSKPAQTAQAAHAGPVGIDDAELIEKAKTAPKFAALWAGDWSSYDSQSSADLALANSLVWWTNHDLARADRLFRSSGLMRKKWDEVHRFDGATYGQMTLERAGRGTDGGYTGQQQSTVAGLLSAFVDDWHSHAPAAGELYHEDGALTRELTDELQQNESDVIRAEISELISWCKSHSFEQFVPLELQSASGYRTDATDTRVAVALLNVCHERATFTPRISLRDLARRAGVGSHVTVATALTRLDGWFCTRREDGVIDVARRLTIDLHACAATQHMVNLRATYETRLDDDAFLTGYSRTKRAQATTEAKRRGVKAIGQIVDSESRRVIVDDLPLKNGSIVGNPFTAETMVANGFDVRVVPAWRVVLRDYAAGLGETVLRIVDAIEIRGAMNRAELVEATGKTKSAISRATFRAEQAGLLTAEQEHKRAAKIYRLHEDWRETVEDLRPKLKTYMLTTERKARDCQERVSYADRLLASSKTDEAQRRRLEMRKAREQRRWAELMAVLRPDVDPVLWSTAPVQMTAHFMDWTQIMQEQRHRRIEHDVRVGSDLTAENRVLTRHELAQLRTSAGRLGVKLETFDGLQIAAD